MPFIFFVIIGFIVLLLFQCKRTFCFVYFSFHVGIYQYINLCFVYSQFFLPFDQQLLSLYSELEYLSFMYVNPTGFAKLRKRVEDLYKAHRIFSCLIFLNSRQIEF
jgi:hypothetical protein